MGINHQLNQLKDWLESEMQPDELLGHAVLGIAANRYPDYPIEWVLDQGRQEERELEQACRLDPAIEKSLSLIRMREELSYIDDKMLLYAM